MADAPEQTTPQAAPQQTTPQAATPEAEKKEAAPVKVERPNNCSVCNKSIKKKWYYRNGKFFCTKRCWKTTDKKAEEAKPAEQAQPAAS